MGNITSNPAIVTSTFHLSNTAIMSHIIILQGANLYRASGEACPGVCHFNFHLIFTNLIILLGQRASLNFHQNIDCGLVDTMKIDFRVPVTYLYLQWDTQYFRKKFFTFPYLLCYVCFAKMMYVFGVSSAREITADEANMCAGGLNGFPPVSQNIERAAMPSFT